jgi:hypothetical protein
VQPAAAPTASQRAQKCILSLGRPNC